MILTIIFFRNESQIQLLVRRPATIIQLDVKNQNIETFIACIKNRFRRQITITDTNVEVSQANIPIQFNCVTWEWTSASPYLNHQKYHPGDVKNSTTHHLVACYYRSIPSKGGEVFLVSNTTASLQRFVKYAKTDFPLQITKR